MFPAARKGDPITHDLKTPSGVIGPPATGVCPMGEVIIENKPAAHVGCTVECDGKTVHTPATAAIIKGSATVLIHGQSAARWTPSKDTGACGVFLGDPSLSSTRTVLIGD